MRYPTTLSRVVSMNSFLLGECPLLGGTFFLPNQYRLVIILLFQHWTTNHNHLFWHVKCLMIRWFSFSFVPFYRVCLMVFSWLYNFYNSGQPFKYAGRKLFLCFIRYRHLLNLMANGDLDNGLQKNLGKIEVYSRLEYGKISPKVKT